MNSKYFRSWINRRFKTNEIERILVGSWWVEKVEDVKVEIHNHFKRQFSEGSRVRIGLPGEFGQNKLEDADNDFLTAPSSEDEIRRAIWECDSSKSPRPDGFSFGFLKKMLVFLEG